MKTNYEIQREWLENNMPLDTKKRILVLRRLKEMIKLNENALFKAIHDDLGKHEYEVYMTEISLVYREIEYLIKFLKRGCLSKRVKNNYLIGKTSRITYQARGQVLIIAPFNYPIQLSLLPLVGSVAAGNVTLLKLSEQVPNTNLVLKTIIESVFEKGHVCVEEGGKETVETLLSLSHDLIFFTGSTTVGKIVMQAAAKFLTPVVLELGGKSPAVVFKDADIDLAAKKIVWGKIVNSGQTCIAPDYVMVHESVKEVFLNKVITYAKEMVPQPMLKVINDQHANRLGEMVESVKSNVILGGKIELDNVEFTVVDGKNIDSEIFGPILPVISFKNEVDLYREIQIYDYPLALYAFTNSKENVKKLEERIRSGSVMVNDVLMHISNDAIPFGGVRTSGIGAYHGKHSMKVFAHEKPIVEGWKFMNPFLKTPYKSWFQKTKILRKFF